MYKEQLRSKYKVKSTDNPPSMPPFIRKLWGLVDDPETDHLISWSKEEECTFVIKDEAKFVNVLPNHFKHDSMQSFVRQLNMYGFSKQSDSYGIKRRAEQAFKNENFKKNHKYLLNEIKRKKALPKKQDDSTLKQDITQVQKDVKSLRDSLDSVLSVMKQDYEALSKKATKLEKTQKLFLEKQRRHTEQEQMMNNKYAELEQRNSKLEKVVHKLNFLVGYLCTRQPPPTRKAPRIYRRMQMIQNVPEKLCRGREILSDGSAIVNVVNGEEDEVIEIDTDSEMNLNLSSPEQVERRRPITAISQSLDNSNRSPGLSTNPDGSDLVYYVTEVPDNSPNQREFDKRASLNHIEENVLTTPMVRQEMARTQLLEQNNKPQHEWSFPMLESTSFGDTKTPFTNAEDKIPDCKTQHQVVQNIKSEELDSMEFISVVDKSPLVDVQTLASPNHCKVNIGTSEIVAINKDGPDFAPNIVESSKENNKLCESVEKVDQNRHNRHKTPKIQNNQRRSDGLEKAKEKSPSLTVDSNSGSEEIAKKFSSTVEDNKSAANISAKQAFTSMAAAIAAKLPSGSKFTAPTVPISAAPNSCKQSTPGCKDRNDTMVIANYNKNFAANSGNMREEFHRQEELDTIKALWQTGGYALMGLFNDTDVLNSYASSLPAEGYNEKKATQMLTYPSPCDFSELMEGINAKNGYNCNSDSDDDPPRPSSVLNTPYHD